MNILVHTGWYWPCTKECSLPPSPPKKIHVLTNIKSVPRWSYSVSQHNKTYQSLLFGLTEYTHFSSTTIRDVKNIFLEYVVIIFLFGSTTDSSMIHADFIPLPTNYKNKKLLIITLWLRWLVVRTSACHLWVCGFYSTCGFNALPKVVGFLRVLQFLPTGKPSWRGGLG
jgi:hypothetical protein